MATPYSNRIVAFIDILDFSSLIKTLGGDAGLRKKVHRALSEIRVALTRLMQKDAPRTGVPECYGFA
jgi:hypothetical protein